MNKTWLLFFVTLLFSEFAVAGRTINSATVDGASSTTVAAGDAISTAVTVKTTGNDASNNWNSTGWRIATTSGTYTCEDTSDVTNSGTTTTTFPITAPLTDGTYNLYLKAFESDDCTGGGAGDEKTFLNAVIVSSELLCSTETSNAAINEIQTTDNFIEIYLKNNADILNWTLYAGTSNVFNLGNGNCNINGTAALDNSSTGATTTSFPADTYITCDYSNDSKMVPAKGEVLLVDNSATPINGDNVVIDYIAYGNVSADWSVNSICGSLYPSHNANNKDIARIPDGSGDLVDNASNSTKGTSNASPSNAIDHYEIYHDGEGISCLSEDITIKACSNADCSSLATENITATLNLDSLAHDIDFTGGEITSSLTYSGGGTITVSLTDISASANITCYVNSEVSANCEMVFDDSSWIIDVPTITACKLETTATIRAVQSETCNALLTGTKPIKFWSTYTNPATNNNSATNTVSISGETITTSSPGTPVNLTFNSNGEATFTIQYKDAGKMQLDATYSGDGLDLAGNDVFVSKPILAVYRDIGDNAADCTSSPLSQCGKFKKAGETFDLNVKAACWTEDDDTNFRDNPHTPNFELDSIGLRPIVIAPSGGNAGNLSISSFDFNLLNEGEEHHVINDQTISEVGVFSFAIDDPTYYFEEELEIGTSPNMGRFYPDHFEVTNSENGAFGNNACTGFSYSGQTFSYAVNPQLQITAYNAATPDAVTQNYTGDFIKLTTADFDYTLPTTDANQLGIDNASLVRINRFADTTTIIDNADGSLEFAFGDDSYSYLHESNSQIAPFSNAVDLQFTSITDSDDVQTQALPSTLQPSGEPIRFGRLSIANAHGSELVPLAVAVQAEFFNGNNWQPNTLDQCTSFNMSPDFQLSNPETADGSLQAGTATMALDGDTTSATLTNNSPLANGVATMTFAAPGKDNQGYVDIQSQTSLNFGWLLGDYDNDGSYDDEATGRASFGVFKGSDNIIFRREIY